MIHLSERGRRAHTLQRVEVAEPMNDELLAGERDLIALALGIGGHLLIAHEQRLP
jgi:hypothetical protein